MKEVIYILFDINGNIVATYKNKDLIKKLLPAIEAKLVTNIMKIDEVLVNPSIDLIGNMNFYKSYTVDEFLQTLV